MEAGPPPFPPRPADQALYELPSRRRARLVVKVGMALLAALLLAGLGKIGWNSRRRQRERAAWGVDQATYDRISGAFAQRMPSTETPAFQRYVDRHMEALRARGEQPRRAEVESSLRESAATRGVARLSDDDLADYHALRKRMIFTSDRFCPCALDGTRCSEADGMDGLVQLTDEELSRWVHLSAKAALLEVDAPAPLPPAVPEFLQRLQTITEALDEPSRARLERTFEKARSASLPDLCFTVRTIFTGAEKLDEPDYRHFIRALAAVDAGPS